MKRYIKIWNYNKFNRLRLFYRENKYKKKNKEKQLKEISIIFKGHKEAY